MPLEAVHVILTYNCHNECPHCFLHCGPNRPGTFTFLELEGLLEQAAAIEGVGMVYFEGGEPMMYFPLLERGVALATELGLETGIVTGGYFAVTAPDGERWLRRLKDAGLGAIDVSLDALHGTGEACTHARNLIDAARGLGLRTTVVSVSDPRGVEEELRSMLRPGEESSPALLRGRAAHDLVEGLGTHPVDQFTKCSSEDLEHPTRVHVDSYGNVHVCQGILAGNAWETSLARVVRAYDGRRHPIIGPLIEGGPAALSREHVPGSDAAYATECHACYEVRRTVRHAFKTCLGPAQVYGEEPEPPPTCYD
jgi:hypothetical protein